MADYFDLPQPPEGYPSYDDPEVAAVADELLGRTHPGGFGYWQKAVDSNTATALHAAVRAVQASRAHRGVEVPSEVRATTDTPVRVLRPGTKVGRTLYDAETGALVGMVDTPELAERLCEVVWRDARTRTLGVDEQPIDPGLIEYLDARYGLDDPPRSYDERPEAVEVVAGTAMPPREPTVSELAEQLVWQTRRMLDVQWDVAQTLGRIEGARRGEQ